jgi:hypothetical protein
LLNILTEFEVLIKLVIKMCLNETYSTVQVGKHLSHVSFSEWSETSKCFIAKAFQLCVDYAIRGVQVNQDGSKLNDTHKLLIYADDVNILGGSVNKKRKTQKLYQSIVWRFVYK